MVQAHTPRRPGRFSSLRTALSQVWAWAFSFPALSLLTAALVFIPMLYNLGFYWDDWPSMWILHAFGPHGFVRGFAEDRPLLAGAFLLTTSVLGDQPLAWQLFAVAARWAAGLALWATLRGVWPQRTVESGAAALLFIIYPGFGQQYIAVTYGNAFLIYAIYLFSFAAGVWALRGQISRPDEDAPHSPAHSAQSGRPRWPVWIAAWLTAAVGLLTTEYFIGLELLRPALFFIMLSAAAKATQGPTAPPWWLRIKHTLIAWLPFAAIWLGMIAYRLQAATPRAGVTLFSRLGAAPWVTLQGLAATIGGDFVELNFLGWKFGLEPAFLNDFEPRILWMLAGAAGLSAILAGVWLLKARRPVSETARPALRRLRASAPLVEGHPLAWLLLAGYAFLVSGWPVWVSNLHIELLFPWDRLMLMMLPAAALFAAALVGMLRHWPAAAAIFLAGLVGLSSATQFSQRLVYRQEWLTQQNFFWQMAWRIPQLQPGTLILTSAEPFRYYTDNSLSAPLNWMYDPAHALPGASMYTLLYDVEARLGRGLNSFEPDQPINESYRAAHFTGSTSQAISLFYDPPRCLVALNPQTDRFLPVKPLYIKEITPLSNLSLIVGHPPTPAQPPPAYFGPEPAPGWCTYYEKAALHNQLGQWQDAAHMADLALRNKRHLTEKTVSELNPFIEAYAHSGQWEKALQLTQEALAAWDKTQYTLCDIWRVILHTTPPSRQAQNAQEILQPLLNCKPSLP